MTCFYSLKFNSKFKFISSYFQGIRIFIGKFYGIAVFQAYRFVRNPSMKKDI